jgi:hypothetical protein
LVTNRLCPLAKARCLFQFAETPWDYRAYPLAWASCTLLRGASRHPEYPDYPEQSRFPSITLQSGIGNLISRTHNIYRPSRSGRYHSVDFLLSHCLLPGHHILALPILSLIDSGQQLQLYPEADYYSIRSVPSSGLRLGSKNHSFGLEQYLENTELPFKKSKR